jgi:RIO-like serine/threonine protein kinase
MKMLIYCDYSEYNENTAAIVVSETAQGLIDFYNNDVMVAKEHSNEPLLTDIDTIIEYMSSGSSHFRIEEIGEV